MSSAYLDAAELAAALSAPGLQLGIAVPVRQRLCAGIISAIGSIVVRGPRPIGRRHGVDIFVRYSLAL